jgi:hypothetical protein
MCEPISVGDIDLSPIAGKTYFSIDRKGREEFIYFLMVDRFQDDVVRPIVAGPERSPGIGTPDTFCGGTIKGGDEEPRLHCRPRLHRDLGSSEE